MPSFNAGVHIDCLIIAAATIVGEKLMSRSHSQFAFRCVAAMCSRVAPV